MFIWLTKLFSSTYPAKPIEVQPPIPSPVEVEFRVRSTPNPDHPYSDQDECYVIEYRLSNDESWKPVTTKAKFAFLSTGRYHLSFKPSMRSEYYTYLHLNSLKECETFINTINTVHTLNGYLDCINYHNNQLISRAKEEDALSRSKHDAKRYELEEFNKKLKNKDGI